LLNSTLKTKNSTLVVGPRDIHIALITGLRESEIFVQALRAAGDDFVKPFLAWLTKSENEPTEIAISKDLAEPA
jgi:hypothetical protein